MNSVTWDDWSPLHEAIEKNHIRMVEYLLSKGADTTIRTTGAGHTPLEMADFLGREDITNLLLKTTHQRQSEGALHDASVTLPLRSVKRRVSGGTSVCKYPRKNTEISTGDLTA